MGNSRAASIPGEDWILADSLRFRLGCRWAEAGFSDDDGQTLSMYADRAAPVQRGSCRRPDVPCHHGVVPAREEHYVRMIEKFPLMGV